MQGRLKNYVWKSSFGVIAEKCSSRNFCEIRGSLYCLGWFSFLWRHTSRSFESRPRRIVFRRNRRCSDGNCWDFFISSKQKTATGIEILEPTRQLEERGRSRWILIDRIARSRIVPNNCSIMNFTFQGSRRGTKETGRAVTMSSRRVVLFSILCCEAPDDVQLLTTESKGLHCFLLSASRSIAGVVCSARD